MLNWFQVMDMLSRKISWFCGHLLKKNSATEFTKKSTIVFLKTGQKCVRSRFISIILVVSVLHAIFYLHSVQKYSNWQQCIKKLTETMRRILFRLRYPSKRIMAFLCQLAPYCIYRIASSGFHMHEDPCNYLYYPE